jgi:hypothetical protein
MRSWLVVFRMLLFPLVALFAVLPQSALALTPSQVYESVKDSVVVVKVYDRQGKQTGLASGVVLPSGDIVTNYHVVKAGVRYTVGRGKQVTPATLIAGDPEMDIGLLTAPGLEAKPARLGQAGELKVGEPVYAVGAPGGLELSLSEGIVSQLRGGPPPLIQTTVAISPGSSGGGLFNAAGELVGITTFYLKEGQNLNFALPVEWIGEVAKEKIQESPRVEAPGAPASAAGAKDGCLHHAKVLEKALDWPGLLTFSRRWTQAEPGNYLAWSWLGIAYNRLGRHQEEIEAYREALRLKPDDADAWYELGAAYFCLQRAREAVEAYRDALRLDPDSNAWYFLGWAYAKLGRHQEAIAAWREGLRRKPDDADALYFLGNILAQSGNRSAALEAAKELRRYDPQQAEELFNDIMKP